MPYLEWYQTRDPKERRRAYKLALWLCPSHELVVERIIPDAVHFVQTSAWNKKRMKKITFLHSQLFQLGILRAAEEHWESLPLTPVRGWMWYISYLAQCTVRYGSFATIAGFAGLLSNGSKKDCVDLHNYLDPLRAGGKKISLDGQRAFDDLRPLMYAKFQKIFQTCDQELKLQDRPKQPGDDIYNILKRMIPWETECLPATYPAYCAEQQRRRGPVRRVELERTRVHVAIDQEQCLERVKSWNNRFSATFDLWRLPLLAPNLLGVPGGGAPGGGAWRPPDMSHWDEIDERIQKEILWKEHKEKEKQPRAKTKHGQESTFEVVVDGRVTALLNRRKPSSGKISLPTSARYVEIRDRGSRATVANCHLMDPQELPQKGWKSTVKLFSGEKVHFALFPKPGGDDEGPGISMLVKRAAWPLAYLAGVAELLGERGRRLAELVGRIPAVALGALLLALMLGAGYATGRGAMLQQLNALIEQLGFDKPFDVRFSAARQRSLQLDLRLHTDVVAEAFIDWDDPSQPDPVGGTRIYPGVGIPAGPNKLLLSPITHTYFPDDRVPPDGLRRTVRMRIVPTELPKERPEALSEANLHPSQRIWVLPYGVVLDPPEAELRIVSPPAGEIVTPTTEIQIRAGALTAAIHLLALDLAHPDVYQYLGKLPPPPFGQESTLTRVIDTSQLQAAGPFRLVALSSEQLTARVGDRVEWRDIPQTAPRTEVEVRHAGIIVSPRPGAVVSGIDTVRAQVFLPNTYVAAVLCPAQAGACVVQNNGQTVVPFVEFSRKVFYAGKDTYELFLGITYDPELFKEGAPLAQRPLTDREGRWVYWVGPVPVEEQ